MAPAQPWGRISEGGGSCVFALWLPRAVCQTRRLQTVAGKRCAGGGLCASEEWARSPAPGSSLGPFISVSPALLQAVETHWLALATATKINRQQRKAGSQLAPFWGWL